MTQPTNSTGNPLGLPTCHACGAVRSPGAPMCLSCWQPFDDEPTPASPAAVPAQAPTPVAAPVPVGVGAPPPPVFGAMPTAPQPMAPPDGAPPGWRPPAGPVLPTPTAVDGSRALKLLVAVIAAVVGITIVGGVIWWQHQPHGSKAFFADRFRNGTPPDFFPSLPDFSPGPTGLPEDPGATQTFITTFEPKIRGLNTEITTLEGEFDSWAKGSVDDTKMRSDLKVFMSDLSALDNLTMQSPDALNRGAHKLEQAASDYEIATNAVIDWIDTGSNSYRTTFAISIGDANVHWDEGVTEFYGAAGLQQPQLPHPHH